MISARWLFGHCTNVRTRLRARVSHEASDVYFWSEADLITPRSIEVAKCQKQNSDEGWQRAEGKGAFYLRYLGTP